MPQFSAHFRDIACFVNLHTQQDWAGQSKALCSFRQSGIDRGDELSANGVPRSYPTIGRLWRRIGWLELQVTAVAPKKENGRNQKDSGH